MGSAEMEVLVVCNNMGFTFQLLTHTLNPTSEIANTPGPWSIHKCKAARTHAHAHA